jgi:hypothetical protein
MNTQDKDPELNEDLDKIEVIRPYGMPEYEWTPEIIRHYKRMKLYNPDTYKRIISLL